MYLEPTARLALYVEDGLGKGSCKTADGLLRYGRNPIVAVIDSTCAGKSIEAVSGIKYNAPIVSSVKEAISLGATTFVLGGTYVGNNAMPDFWKRDIKQAIAGKLDIVNGLHDLLVDDPEIAKSAKEHGVRLYDVRLPPDGLPIGSGRAMSVSPRTILTVGTDSNIGKMTTSCELVKEALKKGYRSKMIATGQTGILVSGEGICIDRVIGDFMAGAVEQMVIDAGDDYDYLFVEGQGALAHPGFSGVTLSLLHGCCPKGMVLCHEVIRKKMRKLPYPLPSLAASIQAYEQAAQLVAPSKVLAVAVNTGGLSEDEAESALADISVSTGLPCNDPVRFGCENIFDAILNYEETRVAPNKS